MTFKNKRFLKLMLAGMISVQVVGCGTSANNNTEKNSEVVIESETETEKVSEGMESEIDSEKDTQVSTNDSETEVSESEKVEENKEETKPTHTCEFTTLKNDSNNHWYACSCGKTANSDSHSYDDEYDSSCNGCGYTRSVPERPVENTTQSSNVDWNGGDIYLESINISIPTMVSFNKKGLESTGGDWWWTGSENDKQALSAMNQIYKTCEDFFGGLVSLGAGTQGTNAFSVTQNAIWFSYTDGMKQEFCLSRDANNGYYVLTINRSLKEDIFYNGADISDINRDVVKTLCTFVSGTPTKLYNGLYEDLHGTTFISDSGWTTIGDCKVQFDEDYYYSDGSGSNYKVRYFIKAK